MKHNSLCSIWATNYTRQPISNSKARTIHEPHSWLIGGSACLKHEYIQLKYQNKATMNGSQPGNKAAQTQAPSPYSGTGWFRLHRKTHTSSQLTYSFPGAKTQLCKGHTPIKPILRTALSLRRRYLQPCSRGGIKVRDMTARQVAKDRQATQPAT